jgi:hypothetical protein
LSGSRLMNGRRLALSKLVLDLLRPSFFLETNGNAKLRPLLGSSTFMSFVGSSNKGTSLERLAAGWIELLEMRELIETRTLS